jgi:hypothetical protein
MLCTRFKEAYGLTGRHQAQLSKLLEKVANVSAYRDPLSDPANPTYWVNQYAAEHFSGYRTGTNRDLAEIPSIEILNLVKMAVEQQISIPEDDLRRQVPRLLGYTRRTAKSDALADKAISQLLKMGVVERVEGAIRWKATI